MNDKNSLPERKLPRLKGYDYSRSGAYFVTICTKDRKEILSKIIVGKADICLEPPNLGKLALRNPRCLPLEECMVFNKLELTNIGGIVEEYLLKIEDHYDHAKLVKYVIMPNHIHLLILLDYNGRQRSAFPTGEYRDSLCNIIKAFKTIVHKRIGFTVFQSSFHDHIIRNEDSYVKIWKYIENNPQTWFEDRYHQNNSAILP